MSPKWRTGKSAFPSSNVEYTRSTHCLLRAHHEEASQRREQDLRRMLAHQGVASVHILEPNIGSIICGSTQLSVWSLQTRASSKTSPDIACQRTHLGIVMAGAAQSPAGLPVAYCSASARPCPANPCLGVLDCVDDSVSVKHTRQWSYAAQVVMAEAGKQYVTQTAASPQPCVMWAQSNTNGQILMRKRLDAQRVAAPTVLSTASQTTWT